MKKINKIIVLFLVIILSSCTEVVDGNLDNSEPKLVVEAFINWEKGTLGNQQEIKLTTTGSFYSNTVPTVSGATITITNSSNTVFNFVEIPNTGKYECSNFVPVINETYTLLVISGGQTYKATETLKAVAPITSVTQDSNGGISGNKIEVKANFTDPINSEDYYLFNYKYPNIIKPDYYTTDDEFFNGNSFFSVLFSPNNGNDLAPADVITITHYGVSKNHYEYLNKLLSIAGNSGGGPFQSPPVTVKGNVINQTDFSNYPLGYFSLSESDKKVYTVQ
jgi:hypothetical protein